MRRIFSKKVLVLFMTFLLTGISGNVQAQNLPVIVPNGSPDENYGIRNPYPFEVIHNIVGPSTDGKGLLLDLGDSLLQGRIYTGPYPFEAGESDYDYARYRYYMPLENGAGTLRIDKYFQDKYNANFWPEGQGEAGTMTLGYRLDLGDLGFYDSVVSFSNDSGYAKDLTILEGPFVTMVTSDDPSKIVIAFETDESCIGKVEISRPYPSHARYRGSFIPRANFDGSNTRNHEIPVTGLRPGMRYHYRVWGGGSTHSSVYSFQSAPRPGAGNVSIAFASDSREGIGGGEQNYMGLNFFSMSRLANDAYRKGADFFLFGGDLVNGYTASTDDFRMQFRGWKQAMAGFWRSKAIYPAMGNHEALLKAYPDARLDNWPYETDSAEAIFAEQFFNPLNGPNPADSRRPTYKENLFHFQYGPVLCIAFNNNYWYTNHNMEETYGGSPEGYMMEDQLEWVEDILEGAESDSTIRYILLYAQEPVFPCGGHVKDAMWYSGDNNVRAYVKDEGTGQVIPAGEGIIDVRNRFWKAIAQSSKVAAVLTGDEHCYHRTLIDNTTPVGMPDIDDLNGNGILDDGQYSPNPEFSHPTWHITAGTAGAPYYAREDTPWQPVAVSSQFGYCLFKAGEDKISMTFYSITGQEVECIDDLMAIK